ncbi:MFS transporter [Paeniglutamicibacter antarcticus]|uniref:MFS transporter n=1 Tax=Arthrobacter terrae TaxID=2935737 RepID=A0A931CS13_9MICC|nr:MFS transporter [Arthrobacter terrae]MBG0741540.1 MFS transporter [Arthrobacter terrae]
MTSTTSNTVLSPRERRKAIVAAAAGNFSEWYDFSVYGVVAAVIAVNFFPAKDQFVALLSTYIIFALTYITRPLGGLLTGWIADTYGRRPALALTIAVMTVATAAVGVLPSYAAIGVAAPILLLSCRLLQGLGAGGEYGSAISFLYEHSAPERRARTISYLVSSTFLGVLAGVGFASLLSAIIGNTAFAEWGWRVLFIIALPIGLIGMYIRKHVQETPEFIALRKADELAKVKPSPVRDSFRSHKATMVVFILAIGIYPLITTTITSYFTTFLVRTVKIAPSEAYTITLITDVALILAALGTGMIVDKIGMYRTLLSGALLVAVLGVPIFLIASGGHSASILAGVILGVCGGILAVPAALAVSQMFPPTVRVTAGSFSYNITVILFGATGPLLGVALTGQSGNVYAYGIYLSTIALVSAGAIFLGRSRIRRVDGIDAHSSIPPESLVNVKR